WTHAPETAGKTMAEVTTTALETYRERRRATGGGTSRRCCGKVSATTVNKELSFLRAVFNDYLAGREEADPTAAGPANPVRRRLFLGSPEHRPRYWGVGGGAGPQAPRPPPGGRRVRAAFCPGLDRAPQFPLRGDAAAPPARMTQTPRHKGGNRGGRGAILVT